MIIAAFCIVTLLVFLLVLIVRPELRQAERLAQYMIWSSGIWLVGLLLFGGLAAKTGLMRLGAPQTVAFPQDYLAQGAAGGAIVLIGLIGVLAPVWAAVICRKRKR